MNRTPEILKTALGVIIVLLPQLTFAQWPLAKNLSLKGTAQGQVLFESLAPLATIFPKKS